MSRRLVLALAVGAIVLGACADSDPYLRTRGADLLQVEETTTTESPFDTSVVTVPDTASPDPGSTLPDAGGPAFTLPAGKPPKEYDAYIEAVINDLLNFWRLEYPVLYGSAYVELAGGVNPMSPGDSVTPGCGESTTSYEAVQGNAFYCTGPDFIAYDDADLLPQLVSDLGEVAVGVVMAHEWGHTIQGRIPYEDATIYLEQQADCFAGAWLAHIARGESAELGFDDSQLASALQAMIYVRDQPGSISEDPLAHGSAFDRVGAFEDGFKNGTSQCATYQNAPPPVIQFGYDPTDPNIEAQENAPLEDPSGDRGDIFSLATDSLNAYWPAAVSGMPVLADPVRYTGDPASICAPAPPSIFSVAFYCPSTGEVAIESDKIVQLYNTPEIADFGVVYVIATAWAEAVLATIGSTIEGEQRALAADCLVGSFARSVLPEEFNPQRIELLVTLSPGDLDEAVSTAIFAADANAEVDGRGTPFEKTDAFRLGVLNDLGACQETFGL